MKTASSAVVSPAEVETSFIGWHGIRETKLSHGENHTVVDLSPWVDEDGYGESNGGSWVEKEFPSTVVLLRDITAIPEEDHKRIAEKAYIGKLVEHEKDSYVAEFDNVPPEGEYEVFFPHGKKQIREGRSFRAIPTDLSVESVRSEIIKDPSENKEVGNQ